MAVQYTRKKEDKDERTMNATEFVERMVSLKRTPEQVRQEPKIESKA